MARRKRTTTPQSAAAPSYGADMSRLTRVSALLDVLVPQLVAEAQTLDAEAFAATWKRWTNADALEAAGVFSEVLPAGGGKAGDEARAFAGLAQALAALAFVPGGVTFGKRMYEAKPGDECER